MTKVVSMLLVTDHKALPPEQKVWGTGGWLPPEEREALDWLTLARVSGWNVVLTTPDQKSLAAVGGEGYQWVVLACDPATIGEELVTLFRTWLTDHPIALIIRSTVARSPISKLSDAYITGDEIEGSSIRQANTRGHFWSCRSAFRAWSLTLGSCAIPWAYVGKTPVLAKRTLGQGEVFTLGFHPSAACDDNGSITTLLRQLLVSGSRSPIAWLDFSDTMILRMDDPGTAQNVYSSSWSYPELSESQWIEIGEILRLHDARLSIGYASGWVDDGDADRGALVVDGQAVERIPGRVYDAPLVVYRDKSGNQPGTVHDFASEYRAICALSRQGLVDNELHGYTHMYPDSEAWASAVDRYDAAHWYRELGSYALPAIARLAPSQHPISRGLSAQKQYFDKLPTTLICPGDEWTNEALELALAKGLSLVSSYYLALRHGDRFCWAQHICAPYLDEPNEYWFDSGYPVVGYFHDREPSVFGTQWLSNHLEKWVMAGAKRFLSFRDFAFLLELKINIKWAGKALLVSMKGGTRAHAKAPVMLIIQLPQAENYFQIEAEYEGFACPVSIEWINTGLARVKVKLKSQSHPVEYDS
ncbi:hypothetical protein ACFL3I_05545 [Pseudomonadota bacterium]